MKRLCTLNRGLYPNTMKFLVTGSTGLIGTQIIKDLTKTGNEIYAGYHESKPLGGIPVQLELTNNEDMLNIVKEIQPDVILHLAAMTNVDRCEKEKKLASQINTIATKMLSEQSSNNNSFFVYVSTDYVFDGEHGLKSESDAPNPVNHYGYSKYQGELAVQNKASRWCIVRTSTPFGIHDIKKSFPYFVIENLKERKEINILTDQYTSPTYVPNLSRMVIEVSTRQIQGIFHLAGASRISRYDLALLVSEKLHLDKNLLKQTCINDIKWIAKRPRDSSLDVSKSAKILKEKPLSIEAGLDYFIDEIRYKPN
ncbi:dTDP-4-dehydrorhamnose reductase [Candidatus Nitrosotalea okcheonensis]|uniref:dTDP-4-dehydrorhamnose reductase n=1 Tax=Candidatus Nitrosotalea okcheonensis TaxID=1903276 RepID=A0A2H1FHP8_9ARCH|nr:dTDP-4-dehydrorhamnose reductase [Candidatus Nitrosotalea okcheonensis]SMH72288.1 dTDP-4-dehydrorhamnose reductase [Candidatus Nitrosotalea okcheonensis]